MSKAREISRRYGAHIVLISVAILFLLIASLVPFDELLDLQFFGDQQPEASVAVIGSPVQNAPVEQISPSISPSQKPDLGAVPLLVSNSLSPALNPYTYEGEKPHHEVITYTVQPNDTPIGIAEQFGIKPETLLGGNAFLSEEASALQVGSTLVILPVDGVLHDVGEGDTLERVAGLYGVTVDDIIAYEPNNLEFPYRLYPGTQIMVPGGVREVWFWSAPQLPTSRPSSSDSTGSGIAPQIQGTGTFIWPVGYRRITQHYWYGHPAIDIGLPEGTPVVASDTGTVTWAGWNVYGYGNLIVINHGNGYETYYAHLSGINVSPGQVVYQGNQIGSTGNTGRSSGPHLHFEIRYFNSMLEPLSTLR
jgi:murein DD-endopeptidase MepM/ murein hydrolase activator NlpD